MGVSLLEEQNWYYGDHQKILWVDFKIMIS